MNSGSSYNVLFSFLRKSDIFSKLMPQNITGFPQSTLTSDQRMSYILMLPFGDMKIGKVKKIKFSTPTEERRLEMTNNKLVQDE